MVDVLSALYGSCAEEGIDVQDNSGECCMAGPPFQALVQFFQIVFLKARFPLAFSI
jgi:hypothetical protein